jgi:peptidoglycan/xylan/chitin deacetylase (PgdA/CDA1 family)
MASAMKGRVKRVLAHVGWTAIRAFGRRPEDPRIAIVMYHSAGAGARMSIDPALLGRHFAAIRQTFPRVATIGDIAESHRSGTGEWVAAITFDDGFSDNHDLVLPLLERHGLRATFFVCTGFIDGQCEIPGRLKSYSGLRPMRWEHVRKLVAAGMEIGAHTVSHPLLSQLPAREQEREMVASKERLEEQIAASVVSFALPYGNRGTYTAETLTIAARHFRACCTTRCSTNPADPPRLDGMVILDRVGPSPHDSPEILIEQLTGRWDAMRLLQKSRKRV